MESTRQRILEQQAINRRLWIKENGRKTFDKLIRKYVEAKDETLNTNLEGMYDGFIYDIDGFEMEFSEAEHDGNKDYAAELIDMLKKQVKAVRAMVAAYKKVSFTFG